MDERQELRYIPKMKLSEAEKQIIMLKIEKSKMRRESSILILNKGLILFFAFLSVAVIGVINKVIPLRQLNILVIIGELALIISILSYGITARKEEKELEKTIDELIS